MHFKSFIQRVSFLKILSALTMFAIISWNGPLPSLKNGTWKSTIYREDGKEIVFNMETKDSAGKKILYVINGTEKILVDKIITRGDSVYFEMPFFESGFAARIDKGGNLNGSWLKKGAGQVQVLPFSSIYNQAQRFHVAAPAAHQVNGRWKVEFTRKNNQVNNAVGEFRQKGTLLTGTFLTATGDYRYLEGVVSGDSLKLSAFDGSNAFLFTARIENNNTISGGYFYSGAAGVETWTAKRDPQAALPDGYEATTLRLGENRLNFSFKSTEDKTISINDTAFRGKVVIVQIMGSWCPNCMDETRFLSDYYRENKSKGVEILGLAYEHSTDLERSKKSINAIQNRFNINYPILITGVAATDSMRTEKTLPQLNKIKAFPTSIFIDKKGLVRKIYTGFSGPGTGEHYASFKKDFNATVRGLLAE